MEASFPFKTLPIHFLMAATCSPHPPPPLFPPSRHIRAHTSLPLERWADCWGMRVECHCHRGQRRKGGGYSLLLAGPQVPDVTLFNDIIMTVLRLPLAFSLHWRLCTLHKHTHTYFLYIIIIIQSLCAYAICNYKEVFLKDSL